MEQKLKSILKALKINENLISSIMGGVVVVIMMTMIFNYFKSVNKVGSISNQAAKEEVAKPIPDALPTTYKVKRGDDLWHISEKFYRSGYNYVDIAKANRLANPSLIEKDQELTIPKVEPKKETVETKKTTRVEIQTAKISIEGDKYVTIRGDYLWSIAVRAYGDGYRWKAIYNANKAKIGNNPNLIYAGVELVLPR